jgi:hypothetical protein
MRTSLFAKAAGVAFALGTIAAVAGCDTNYYGDSGRSTTTTTTTAVPPPPATSSTTTVTPNYDGSVTTTERTYHRY